MTLELRHHFVSAERLETHSRGRILDQRYLWIVSSMAENGEDDADLDRLDFIRSKFDEACEITSSAEEELAIRDLQATVQALVAENEDLRGAVQRRATQVSNLQAALSTNKALRHKLKADLKARSAENKALRREMQLLTGGFSWQPSKPLRVLTQKLPRAGTFLKASLKS